MLEKYLTQILENMSNSIVQVEYKCTICKDIGMTIHKDEFGIEFAQTCKCQIRDPQKYPLEYWKRSNYADYAASDKMKKMKYTKDQTAALNEIKDFLYNYKENKAFYFYSNSIAGTGKTMLACRMAINLTMMHGLSSQFIATHELKDMLHECIKDKIPIETVRNPLRSVEVLVIDDLGAEKTSEFFEETLYSILDYRLIKHKTTIFTSNLAQESLSYGKRIISRIKGLSKPLKVSSNDFREL